MSNQTTLYTAVNFCGKTYNSKEGVRHDYDNILNHINEIQDELKVLCYMTEPQKFKEDNETADMYIKRKTYELLENLEDCIVQKYKLELLLAAWDYCHNEQGLGIDPPEEVQYKSFITGDFVFTEKRPTNELLLS